MNLIILFIIVILWVSTGIISTAIYWKQATGQLPYFELIVVSAIGGPIAFIACYIMSRWVVWRSLRSNCREKHTKKSV